MIDLITRTLVRIASVAVGVGGRWLAAVAAGLAQEFKRVCDFRDMVMCAAIPSDDLCDEAIDDLERKFGISKFGAASMADRKSRILERASFFASGGPDWLQAQIQAAGFPLYVIENLISGETVNTQFGDQQFDETTQFGVMPNRTDPSTVPGVLITSSASGPGGAMVDESSQFGLTQFGGTTEFGTQDTDYIYPLPAERVLPTDPSLWGRVFFLSPFPDRLATEDELLYLSTDQRAYLIRLVTQLKFLRNWCIAQVSTRVIVVDELDGAILTFEDGAIWVV